MSTAVIFEILGLDGKVITGFPGKNYLILALGRGDVDCMVTSDNEAKRDETNGLVVNLITTGSKRSTEHPFRSGSQYDIKACRFSAC